MSFEYICRSIGKTIFRNLYRSDLWHFHGSLRVEINRYSKNFSVGVLSYGEFDQYVSLYNCFCSLWCIFSVSFQLTYRCRGSWGELKAEAAIQVQKKQKYKSIILIFGFYLFISLHTERHPKLIKREVDERHVCKDLYTKAVMKNVFHYNNRNMWLRGEIVFAWWTKGGRLDWWLEVRLSPTCAFLSRCAGREMKSVFRCRNLRYVPTRSHPDLANTAGLSVDIHVKIWHARYPPPSALDFEGWRASLRFHFHRKCTLSAPYLVFFKINLHRT